MTTDFHETLRGLARRELKDAELRTIAALLAAEPPATLADARAAVELFTPMLVNAEEERFGVAALDRRGRVIASAVLSVGSVGATVVDTAKVLRWTLMQERPASGFVVSHNHPSGDASPSREDDTVTRMLGEAAGVVGLELIDHVIVTVGGFYSYAQNGRMTYRTGRGYPTIIP